MSRTELASRLRGVLAFPVTPFTEDLELDLPGLRRNVAWLSEQGVHGLVIAGGTGEFFGLTTAECKAIYRAVAEEVGGRLPIIAGVGVNLHVGRELARAAQDAGCDAALVLPAHYGRADEEGMYRYYAGIAQSVDIGVIPYNRDPAVFSPALLARLAEIENVVAFKDGYADLRLWARLRERVGPRLVWLAGVGDDMVNTYFAAGAEGFTSSIANFAPKVARALFDAASQGDFPRVNRILDEQVLPIYSLRARRRGYEVTMTKEAMNLLGMPAGPVRPPLAPAAPEDRAELARILEQIGLLARR